MLLGQQKSRVDSGGEVRIGAVVSHAIIMRSVGHSANDAAQALETAEIFLAKFCQLPAQVPDSIDAPIPAPGTLVNIL